METPPINPIELLLEVIREHPSIPKWVGAPLGSFRNVEGTNKGAIGEVFIRRYLEQHGITVGNGSRLAPTDMTIKGWKFEVKTASEGVSGSFQFNHVRLDREYDYLLCLGISPESIRFNVWSREAVVGGGAGNLVPMAQEQRVTFKLTKRVADMRPIENLPEWVHSLSDHRP